MFDQIMAQLVLVAAFVERGVQFLKTLVKYNDWAGEYQAYVDQSLSVLGSAGLCYAWKLDLFAIAGIEFGTYAWAGSVLTGVVAGFGGSILHEMVELLKAWRRGPNPEPAE